MRLKDAVETNEPCPDCKGTGHSGNLHDETCPTCDGGGRVHVIGLDEAQKRRYLTDKRFYDGCNAMVLVLRALKPEDVADAMAVALVIHRGRPQDDVERRYREVREMEQMIILHQTSVPASFVHDGSGVARTPTPDPIPPASITRSMADYINRPNPLMEAAGTIYPPATDPAKHLTRKTVVEGKVIDETVELCHARDPHSPRICMRPKGHKGDHEDIVLKGEFKDGLFRAPQRFIDTDKEWP